MEKTKLMVNGIPGKMASKAASFILSDARYDLIPESLTGPEIENKTIEINGAIINLIRPKDHESCLKGLKNKHQYFIAIDYTHPSSANKNAEMYCENGVPFVMGTTGGDRNRMIESVKLFSNLALISPNMAKQIVGFQSIMEFAANHFPGIFKGYSLTIRESHQKGKADTSGTARAMVQYFKAMGIQINEDEIVKERDPGIQKNVWGIPDEFLDGHGWHTYTLLSEDETVKFEFTHNVNGRDIYALGTIDAIEYLKKKIQAGEKGKVYSMIDLLKDI